MTILTGLETLNPKFISFEQSPLIQKSHPPASYCFFTGPLFLEKYSEEMVDFYKSVASPLDVLRDDRRRTAAVNLLLSLTPEELFSREREVHSLLQAIEQQGSLYQRFDIQRNGKTRHLAVPKDAFRDFLEAYVLPLVLSAKVHPACHGGEKGWSVERSLGTHLPLVSAVSFDMSDAYQQATINYVFDFFYDNLPDSKGNAKRDLAGLLASACTVVSSTPEEKRKGAFEAWLPQGSPLSTALFNRMMRPVDEALGRQARKKGMRYSRWIDDFVLSSPKRRRFEHFADVMRIAQENCSIAPQKLFFFYNCPAYLLGHRVSLNTIEKVSREEFNEKRGEPYTALENTHPRGGDIYMQFDDFLEETVDDSHRF